MRGPGPNLNELEEMLRAKRPRRRALSLWDQLGLPTHLRASAEALDPSVIPVIASSPGNAAARVEAANIILHVDDLDEESLRSVAATIEARMGRETIMQRRRDGFVGTRLAEQIDAAERALTLLGDATGELKRLLDARRSLDSALGAIEASRDPVSQWSRLFLLRLHNFLAASTTLGDYVRQLGHSAGGEALWNYGNTVRLEPRSAFIAGLRGSALHEQLLPATPFLRATGDGLEGTVTLSCDELASMRNWRSPASEYLAVQADVIDLHELSVDHLEERRLHVPTFIETVREHRRAILAHAQCLDAEMKAAFRLAVVADGERAGQPSGRRSSRNQP